MEGPRAFSWRREDVHGVSLGRVEPIAEGFLLEGWETAADATRGWSVAFTVAVDTTWRTRDVLVEVAGRFGRRALRLSTDGAGHWTSDKAAAPALEGCLDVDIAATPLTNTMPIRRLDLRVGESREILAAWIDVPDLELEPVRQRYARLHSDDAPARYEYTTVETGARYELTVDDDGLVIDYARFARRLLPR
jgi:hypothetical protein